MHVAVRLVETDLDVEGNSRDTLGRRRHPWPHRR